MGHLLGFALVLLAGVLILLLMPGMILVSAFLDLSGISSTLQVVWASSFLVSLVVLFLTMFLAGDRERGFKIYGGICIAMLIASIILSAGCDLHFGKRWTWRFIGNKRATQSTPAHNTP